MKYKIQKIAPEDFPPQLLEIPQPPDELYICGTMPSKDMIHLAVVGSRKHTTYGKDACEKLIKGLRGYPIVIVSGLALGIDSIAHRAALDAGLATIAIPGSGLNSKVIYPATNIGLAEKIVESGGCLLSEFAPDFRATVWSFPQRNRIMAGLCKAVLIIEAEEKSGTLVTARLALDYNRDVLVVPGSILSSNSDGPNRLIRTGATPIRSSIDILEALGFDTKIELGNQISREDLSGDEQKIFELLVEPLPRDELIRQSGLPVGQLNGMLSIMEIKGFITESLGEIHRIN